MALTSGTRIGPYDVTAQIGVGGMGEVYRATDTNLGRTVAIKVLPDAVAQDPERIARFEREAKTLAQLNHPNIAAIYGLERAGECPALVIELVEGPTLSDRIGHGALPVDDALAVARQIVAALEAAHQQGIIHRDLKPANIKVRSDGTVKILDFGLAKLQMVAAAADAPTALDATQPGLLLGTAAYMSPEQARGGPTDARSDIFSFGAVLHEMLSGGRAFGGDSIADVLTAVIRDEPAAIDSPASAIVTRCLAKRPADRYQSMTELKRALEAVTVKASASRQPSIAVLPFTNMSHDPDDEYFSDGLAEEIINLLAHIPGLKVIARTSSFAFRGKEQDITKIAETLRVNTILEGSVRRAGNRVRVTAQLIAADDGSHLFSERYDREMADVFAMQDEIAAAVTAALRMKLSVQPAAGRPYTPGLPAYEAVLKARHQSQQLTPDSMARAREYLTQAIALDPAYPMPHVALGRHYLGLAVLGVMPAHEAMPRAREEARQAMALDPSHPEALSLLGLIAAIYEYDWKEAERLFDVARAHALVAPETRSYYGTFLNCVGRSEEAVEELRRAVSDDPLNQTISVRLISALVAARRFSDAASHGRRFLEVDEHAGWIWFLLSLGGLSQGGVIEATAAAERASALMPWNPDAQAQHAGLLARRGDDGAAQRLLTILGDGHTYGAPGAFMTYFLARGDTDQAVDWAAKAIEQRSPPVMLMLRMFESDFRQSPRWPELMKLVNLPYAG